MLRVQAQFGRNEEKTKHLASINEVLKNFFVSLGYGILTAHRVDQKELKMGYNIDVHDYSVRLSAAQKFLKDGDKELLYANCISEEEYHTSKTPLLQRLSAQGVKIDPKDVVISGPQPKNTTDEWAVIDLKDSGSKNNSKQQKSTSKVKGATSGFGLSSSSNDAKNLAISQENPFWNCEMEQSEQEKPTILMSETVVKEESAKKAKRRPFNGFMKWKKSDDSEKDTAPLSLNDSAANETYLSNQEGQDTKIKRKLQTDVSSSDFFVDKVLADKIKKELMKTKSELQLSDEQIEVISTRLPIDKADLKKFFSKKWCDQYGENVLEVVRKEYKDHVNEIRNLSHSAMKKEQKTVEEKWTTFDDDDENCHPNLFADRAPVASGPGSHKDDRNVRVSKNRISTDRLFKSNPFFDY